MIPRKFIDKFLNRRLDDHQWMKKLKPREVDAALDQLDPPPDLFPKMRLHQKVCFLLGTAFPTFGFWLDMGSGKTLITLELLRYWYKIGRLRRAVIFITSDKAFPTWERQIERFGIDVPYISLDADSSKEKWRLLDSFGDGFVLVTYPGAVRMVSRMVRAKRGRKLQLDPKLVAKFSARVDGVAWDESTRVAGNSLTNDFAEKLSDGAFARYGLAGRPFGRDPTPMWRQFYLIDRGETLGDTLGLFRAAFFSEKDHPYVSRAKEYKFNKRMSPKLNRLIQHRSISYSADECIELPKVNHILEEVRLPEEAGAYYERAIQHIIAEKGNLRGVKNVFLRMRQLSSGFMGVKDDETGEKAEIEFDQNPKLDRLIDLAVDIPYGRKAVIFYEFTWSGRRIMEALKAEGRKAIWLWSGTKDYRRDIARFLDDPDYEFAVLNNKVGAYSLDGLQEVANYTFFYESPVSPIDREQAERRLRRDGQKHKVFQIDIIMRGTVDSKILAFHREGADLFSAIVRDPAKIFR